MSDPFIKPEGLLTIYDPEKPGEIVAQVSLSARVIQLSEIGQETDENLVAIALEASDEENDPDIEIRPEWVGMNLSIEVAPSAVQGPDKEDEVDQVAVRWGAEVA